MPITCCASRSVPLPARGRSPRLATPILISTIVALVAVLAGACAPGPPRTAEEVLARSVKAHGGDRLTSWTTYALRGRVELQDGIAYNAAYTVLAKAPDRLRVEQDMTADRGRIFTEYFLNGADAWSRRNLVPGRATLKQMERWRGQCFGVAYYAQYATAKTLNPAATVEWRWRAADSKEYTVQDRRPAYVVVVMIKSEPVELFIDKETFYLLQEVRPELRRLHHDFNVLGGIVMPTRVLEITRSRDREVLTPYTFESLALNEPIEDWLFEEDRPRTR
jgi:hypothetical protein